MTLVAVFACSAQASADLGPATRFPTGDAPFSIAVGDLNNDGVPDMATGLANSGKLAVFFGDGSGAFSLHGSFAAGLTPYGVAAADLDGDGDRDLVSSVSSSDSVAVLLGDGTGDFAAPQTFPVGTEPHGVAVGDLNGDHIPDLAVANSTSGDISVLLGTGTGSFGAAVNYPSGGAPVSLLIRDLNGDGNPDLAAANANSSDAAVLLGNGAGTFSSASTFSSGTSAPTTGIAAGDFNEDGHPDLALSNMGLGLSVLLGDGTGSFGAAIQFKVPGKQMSAVAASDLNGDGHLDLAVSCSFGSCGVSTMLGDGTGQFHSDQTFETGLAGLSVAIDDLNGDDYPDLVAPANGDTVVFLNNGPEAQATPASLSFPAQAIGSISSKQSVTIDHKTPGFPIGFDHAQITGANAGDFAISSDTCSISSLTNGHTCQVGIRFAPQTELQSGANLELSYSGTATPLSVPLSGQGIPASTGRTDSPFAKIVRPGAGSSVKVPENRHLNVARIDCGSRECEVRKVRVLYRIGGKRFRGTVTAPDSVAPNASATVKATMPQRLLDKLKPGRVSGTVTAVISITSPDGDRLTISVRTGLIGRS